MAPQSPEETAESAGLTYVDTHGPGYGRRRRGRGFSYCDEHGQTIQDRKVRDRISGLAIPPAWEDVWISPFEDGHVQATGRDKRGRKQYLYHEAWREARDRHKFQRMVPFGLMLPALRRTVGRDLRRDGVPFERVAAAAVRILDVAAIRVGNDHYAVANGSFGLTTLRGKHLEIEGHSVVFDYVGKGGKPARVSIEDATVLEVIRELDDLPGYRVFQYLDDDGGKTHLTSDDVNDYIRMQAGPAFQAKDFRTWAANTLLLDLLWAAPGSTSDSDRAQTVRDALDEVAATLNNTRSVAQSSYADPRIVDSFLSGDFDTVMANANRRADQFQEPGRRRQERLTLAVLSELD